MAHLSPWTFLARGALRPYKADRRCVACIQKTAIRGAHTQKRKLPSLPAQPSKKVRLAQSMEQITGDKVRHADLGILPDTFITARFFQRPPFSKPLERLKYELRRMRQHIVRDFGSIITYCKYKQKPRVPLYLFRKAKIAVNLHRQMSEAVADGDEQTIYEICTTKLARDLVARINSRGRDKLSWKLHRYIGRPKVVSSRAGVMSDDAGIRQAVVRIRSVQSLTRYRPNGEPYPNTGQEKELEEYFVIQKFGVKGKEEPWVIWGTTKPTTSI